MPALGAESSRLSVAINQSPLVPVLSPRCLRLWLKGIAEVPGLSAFPQVKEQWFSSLRSKRQFILH